MKKLFYLLAFIPILVFGQSQYEAVDIDAAAGNEYETLLTNVAPAFPDLSIQQFLQQELKMYETINAVTPAQILRTFEPKLNQGKDTRESLKVTINVKSVPGQKRGVVEEIILEGSWEHTALFFVSFWSAQLDLGDVSIGEIASRRFLTDVATLSYLGDSKGMIKILSTKDRI